VCTVPKILKMPDKAGDICGHRAFWHLLLRIICAVHVQTYVCQKNVLTPIGLFLQNARQLLTFAIECQQ